MKTTDAMTSLCLCGHGRSMHRRDGLCRACKCEGYTNAATEPNAATPPPTRIAATEETLGDPAQWRIVDLGSGVQVRKHRQTFEVWMTCEGDGGRWFTVKHDGREGVLIEAALRMAERAGRELRGDDDGRSRKELRLRIEQLERQLAERALADAALLELDTEDT